MIAIGEKLRGTVKTFNKKFLTEIYLINKYT